MGREGGSIRGLMRHLASTNCIYNGCQRGELRWAKGRKGGKEKEQREKKGREEMLHWICGSKPCYASCEGCLVI